MVINAKTKLCCIIGNPVEHSLSPQMHNAGFRELNLNYVFLAFRVENVKRAIEGLKELRVKRIVVTVPHKIEVMKYIDALDEDARKIGAVNAILNKNGKLFGTNTDWYGALRAIEEKTKVAGKKVALLGAGGAARALAFGLKKKGGLVSVFNRTVDKARRLKKEFELFNAYPISYIQEIQKSDIIVNTTSIGMHPHEDESPVPDEAISKRQCVFDAVYTPLNTKLIKAAKSRGAKIIYGDKMVLYGAIGIFELFTGHKAPIKIMESSLKANLF